VAAADHPCATFECDQAAHAVYVTDSGTVFGVCREHLPYVHARAELCWVWPPDEVIG
jgi:hypothetical protein